MQQRRITIRPFHVRQTSYRTEDGYSILDALVTILVLVILSTAGFFTYSIVIDNSRTAAVEIAATEVFTRAQVHDVIKARHETPKDDALAEADENISSATFASARIPVHHATTPTTQALTTSQYASALRTSATPAQYFQSIEEEYNNNSDEIHVDIEYERGELTVIATGWVDYVSVRSTIKQLDGTTEDPREEPEQEPTPKPTPTPTPEPTTPSPTPEPTPTPTPTPEPTPEPEPEPEPTFPDFVTITGGNSYACGIADGKGYCWGNNNQGQLGIGSNRSTTVPTPVDTSGALRGKELVDISAGDSHTVALDSNGTAYAWGKNNQGQLGTRSGNSTNTPVAVDTSGVLQNKQLIDISAGDSHTVAIDSNGKAYAWGKNNQGQLGTTQRGNVHIATVDTSGVLKGKHLVQVSAGNTHTVALDSDGKAYAWGQNNQGQLGVADNGNGKNNGKGNNSNGNGNGNNSPVVEVDTSGVLHGKTLTQVSTQWDHTLAIDSNGKAYAWGGNNNQGQLGAAGNGNTTVVEVDTSGALNGKHLVAVSAGESHSIALDRDGNVYGWGRNTHDQLGNTSAGNSSGPVAVDTSLSFTAIAAGDSHTIAVASDGAPYGWGKNNHGQLGQQSSSGNKVSSPSPLDIDELFVK